MDLLYLRLVIELGEIPVRGAPDAPCHVRSHLLVCLLVNLLIHTNKNDLHKKPSETIVPAA